MLKELREGHVTSRKGGSEKAPLKVRPEGCVGVQQETSRGLDTASTDGVHWVCSQPQAIPHWDVKEAFEWGEKKQELVRGPCRTWGGFEGSVNPWAVAFSQQNPLSD